MKFLNLTILLSLLVLIEAAILPRNNRDISLDVREIEKTNVHAVPSTLPHGRRRIAFYMNDKYDGCIIEGRGNATYTIYDPFGNIIDLPDIREGNSNQRQPRAQTATKSEQLIAKWGKRVQVSTQLTYYLCIT